MTLSSRRLWYIFTPLCLWSFFFILYCLSRPSSSIQAHDLETAGRASLTAILPVTAESLGSLAQRLVPLYFSTSCLYEIIVECPKSLAQNARQILHGFIPRSNQHRYPLISLHLCEPRGKGHFQDLTKRISTEWVLMLSEKGLEELDDAAKRQLLNPLALSLPRGFTNGTCAPTRNSSQFVDSPAPPFIISTSLVQDWEYLSEPGNTHWLEEPGIILPHYSAATEQRTFSKTNCGNQQSDPSATADYAGSIRQHTAGQFGFLMPTFSDLRLLFPLSCRLQSQSFVIFALVYDDEEVHYPTSISCFSSVRLVKRHSTGVKIEPLRQELRILQSKVNVVIAPKGEFPLLLESQRPGQVTIEIPRAELQYSQWMGSLTLREWLNWSVPHISISVITQNRPWSLNRLLISLSQGLFFGDKVDLKINLEQSSDVKTMELVDSFTWNHGTITVNHRVIHGGLLPAVVESWYPHANHTYALLLEDDIELSPLFYAWIKMSVLRYRYGDEWNYSPQLFGISLYQQKHLELPMEGRQLFNARTLFRGLRLDPSTPYLSPVPCSWGAVYFPNHWREFHNYITVRLSERSLKVDQDIVPNVRSNHWTKSWKKYFIELAFLRGYVMLYPNFVNYTSLSTNHLELGSHVKHRTKEKQDLFQLPLMGLPRFGINGFELPNNTLPYFDALPVINLTGSVTQLDALRGAGALRRLELLNCAEERARLFDAQSLMCID